MSSYLTEIKLKIGNFATALKELVPTCRIGLVTYRDKQDEYLTKIHPLTYGISSLHDFLNQIEAGGGYDVREAVTEGLKDAIESFHWSIESKKIILLIGDAPPHTENVPQAMELVGIFREEMGGTLFALDVRKPKDIYRWDWTRRTPRISEDPELDSYDFQVNPLSVIQEFALFAQLGGGTCERFIDQKGVIKHMLLIVLGTRWQMYLDEFTKDL
jgi:hypothetical protein